MYKKFLFTIGILVFSFYLFFISASRASAESYFSLSTNFNSFVPVGDCDLGVEVCVDPGGSFTANGTVSYSAGFPSPLPAMGIGSVSGGSVLGYFSGFPVASCNASGGSGQGNSNGSTVCEVTFNDSNAGTRTATYSITVSSSAVRGSRYTIGIRTNPGGGANVLEDNFDVQIRPGVPALGASWGAGGNTVTRTLSSTGAWSISEPFSYSNTGTGTLNMTNCFSASPFTSVPSCWESITNQTLNKTLVISGNSTLGSTQVINLSVNSYNGGTKTLTITINPPSICPASPTITGWGRYDTGTTTVYPGNYISIYGSNFGSPSTVTGLGASDFVQYANNPDVNPDQVNIYLGSAGSRTYTIDNGNSLCTKATQSVNVLSPASGTLSATSCTIPINGSTCNSLLTWNASNTGLFPVAVTKNQPAPNTNVSNLASGNNVSNSITINPGNDPSTNFYLYFNPGTSTQLQTTSATANCASGSTWNGSSCVATASPSGTLSTSSCSIPLNSASCSLNLSWTTANLITSASTAITRSVGTPASFTPSPLASGSQSATVSVGVTTFYLYHNSVLLASVSVNPGCASGTTWNGSICAATAPTMSGTLTSSSSSCAISLNGSTCGVTMTWSTVNPVATSGVTGSSTGTTVLASGNNSSSPITVHGPSENFYLYNSGVQLSGPLNITTTCSSGSWDGVKCAGVLTPSATLTSAGCTITSGSSCSGAVDWSVTNPASSTTTISNNKNNPTSSTVSSALSGSIPVTWSGGVTTTYTLTNSSLTKTLDVTPSCPSGKTWSGTACVSNYLLPATTSCQISSGQNQCTVNYSYGASWSGQGWIAIYKGASLNAGAFLGATPSIGTINLAIGYGVDTCVLTDNSATVAYGISACTATCVSGTSWDTASQTCKASGTPPSITGFTSSSSSVYQRGKTATLSWSVAGSPAPVCAGTMSPATYINKYGQSVANTDTNFVKPSVSSPVAVTPLTTSTYTITCSNGIGSPATATMKIRTVFPDSQEI